MPKFSSLLLTEITVFCLILFVSLLIDPNFLKSTSGIRFYNIVFNIGILLVLYKTLVSDGKSERIISEFKDSPINTKRNRIICWIIFVISFLAPMSVAVINKGYISLT